MKGLTCLKKIRRKFIETKFRGKILKFWLHNRLSFYRANMSATKRYGESYFKQNILWEEIRFLPKKSTMSKSSFEL